MEIRCAAARVGTNAGSMNNRSVPPGAAKLKAAQNYVRGSAAPRAAVSKARALVPASEMQAFVDWLPTVRRKGRGIAFDHFPSSLGQLWRSGTLSATTLPRETAWAAATFRRHARALAEFRLAARAYEVLLVGNRHAACFEQLDRMEQEFGTSLWILESRMALLQCAEGLEAQKSFAAEVRKSRGQNDVVAFLAYHLSRRNEPSTTPLRYVQHLEDLVGAWDDAENLGAYFLYRLGNQAPATAARYADVLRLESSAALVDHYETFVQLAACAASMGDDLVKAAFRGEVVRLAGLIEDERLRRAAFLLTGTGRWLDGIDANGSTMEDALLLGDAETAVALADAAITADPADARAWMTKAASLSPADEAGCGDTLCSTTVARVRRMLGRTGDADRAIVELLRDGLNHRLQDFSIVVNAAVWGEMFAVPALALQLEAQAFVYGRGLRPSDVGRVIGAGAGAAVEVAVRSVAPGHRSPALTEQLVRANLDVPPDSGFPTADLPDLPADAVKEAELFRALGRGDHDAVVRLAERLADTTDLPRRRRVRRLLSLSLLQVGNVPELTRLIAAACVEDPALVRMLPLAECAQLLDRAQRKRMAGELASPILLDLFSKHFDDSLDDARSYAYEDFLLFHGMERPAQLDGREDGFDRPLLVHYLRHICVPGVMQVSSAFQGTRELEDERKKVLSLLVKLDPQSAKEYEAELREVTRAQLIHRGVRHVERSKIYVDVPAIRRAFEKKHRETFQRYQALGRAGIGTDDVELEAALQEALSGKPLPQQVLEVPKNEANDLLLQMLRWLYNECTTSPEHGLDCYLSLRIRHGTLSGQLRTPLEIERIITQRGSDGEEYGSNLHWLERLRHLPDEAAASIDARLSRFSADYDAFISRIAQEMIQIHRSDRPFGLFRISLRSVRFRLWVADLRPDMTFEEFFESAMEIFWESVEHSLGAVRETIDAVLKPEVNAKFAELEKDLRSLAGTMPTADLDRAVRTARTGTLQALDLVKDWFRLSQPISEPAFPIGDLIDVGLQCVKAIHHDFAPVVTRDVDPLPPFAGALVLFSDIFFIIFDNVRRHAGMGPDPHVSIEVRSAGDRLRIVARNEVADGIRNPETVERIEAIERAIAEGDYGSAVRSEGGTGLIKLRKLIGSDAGEARRLRFGFDDAGFHVELELGLREIQT